MYLFTGTRRVSNKSDILRLSLSLSPFSSALHSCLFMCPLDATEVLGPNRQNTHMCAHTPQSTHHPLTGRRCRFCPSTPKKSSSHALSLASLTIFEQCFVFIALCSLIAPIAITLACDKSQIYKAPAHSLFSSCSFSVSYCWGM